MSGVRQTILYVHSGDELYGSDTALLRLIAGLDRARYRPLVVLPTDLPYAGLLSRELRRLGVECVHLDLAVVRRRYATVREAPRFVRRLRRSTAVLAQLIDREGVALVHSNTLVVWPGALAARLTGRRHVWQIHELLTGPAVLRRLFGCALLALATVVVPNSHATSAGLFLTSARGGRVQVIPNGVAVAPMADPRERARLRAEWGIGPHEILIGTIGRVSPRKGLRELLAAARTIVAQAPAARLVIVGGVVPGQEAFAAELEAEAALGPLAGRVHLAGFHEDVASVLEAVDIVAAPVVQPESFGLAVAEAMAHGKPVVASRLGGLAEVVVDGVTGLLVPAGDTGALAGALLQLVKDADLRTRLGARGRDRVARRFSLAAYVGRFATLYERILGECSRGRPGRA